MRSTTRHPSETTAVPQTTTPQPERVLTVSNILSVSRILLAVPFILVMQSEAPSARYWGIIIMAVAMLTDKLDGDLARKYGQTTELGKILDPLADKIGVAVVALVLLSIGIVPLWFVVAMIVRDVLIFLGGVYIKSRKKIILSSNLTGKWAVGVVSATLLAALLNAPVVLVDIMIAASVVMLAWSLYLYAKRFLEIVRTTT